MGADLICYIALGPKRIDFDQPKGTHIARQVREYLDACITAAERLLLGEKDVPDPRPGPVEARRSFTLHLESLLEHTPGPFGSLEELRRRPDYQDLVRRALNDCDRTVEAEHAFTSTPETLAEDVRAFIDGWNEGRFRDLSSREDPRDRGRKVVVAGELSSGGEPSGAGYQVLKKAFGLTIAQLLGVS